MIRSDAAAREPRVTFDYFCPETDRTATATVPLKDVYPDRSDCDGYYDPPTYADVAECPACGGQHVVSVT